MHWDCKHEADDSPSALSNFLSLCRSVRNRLFTRVDLPRPDSPASDTHRWGVLLEEDVSVLKVKIRLMDPRSRRLLIEDSKNAVTLSETLSSLRCTQMCLQASIYLIGYHHERSAAALPDQCRRDCVPRWCHQTTYQTMHLVITFIFYLTRNKNKAGKSRWSLHVSVVKPRSAPPRHIQDSSQVSPRLTQ